MSLFGKLLSRIACEDDVSGGKIKLIIFTPRSFFTAEAKKIIATRPPLLAALHKGNEPSIIN